MSKKILISTLLLVSIWGKGFLMAQHLMHYTSERFEYSMQLPEDWKRTDQVKNSNIAMVLISPEDAAISVSFYQMKELNMKGFIDGYKSSMQSKYEDQVLLEKGVFLARDDAAEYLIFNYTKGEDLMREKVCFFQRKNEMAVVTARQTEKKFAAALPVIDKLFTSFTFETLQEKVDN